MIAPPPNPFPGSNSYLVKAGTAFHRVHDQRFGSCVFNPGKGRPSRFAPLMLATGPIPTQYLATSYECAVHETIFHDVPFDEPDKTVGVDNIKPLAHSIVALAREIVLAPLFTPDLARWNLTRADLIDTTANFYHVTSQWALAIHQSRPDIHGLIWTSKRCDPDQALLLFGDRLSDKDLKAVSKTAIFSSIAEMKEIKRFADRSRIDLVM